MRILKNGADITQPLIQHIAEKVSKTYSEDPETVLESIGLAVEVIHAMANSQHLKLIPLLAEVNPNIVAETSVAMAVLLHLDKTIRDESNDISIILGGEISASTNNEKGDNSSGDTNDTVHNESGSTGRNQPE